LDIALYNTPLIATNRQIIMAGPESACHVFACPKKKKDVDARDKHGHDVERSAFRH
jgi:hypothetical protein